jgi:SprB repeat
MIRIALIKQQTIKFMKKLYILLIVLGFAQGFGQTFTIVVKYRASSAGCHGAGYNWELTGDSNTIDFYDKGGNGINVNTSNTYSTVPNYNSFNLLVGASCIPLGAATLDCSDNFNETLTSVQLIQGSTINLSVCNGDASIQSFKPNLTIQKSNPSTLVCSGELLDLVGTPSGFPKEAYHWQYSLDNQVTWVDVPAGFNDNKTTNFSIIDILGVNHENYFGKQIYFRLGYSGRPFTTPIAINYSACAPVIKDRSYLPPLCNGDPVQSIDVYFEKPLEPNEDLFPMQIILYPKTAGDVAKFSQNPVTQLIFDATTGWYKYSFIIPVNEQLENNKNYTIEYQARKNLVPRGVLTSSNPFLYSEPAPVLFTATAIPAQCFGEKGKIEITATGGSGIYRYKLNAGDPTEFVSPIIIEVTSTTDSTIKNHSIRVTDDKGCYDVNVND